MLRLRGGEFAIGMWVVAELAHLLVNLDTLVNGETGTSLIALNAYPADLRRALTYWCALAAMAGLLAIVFFLLRSPLGAAIQAIRDDEEAAESVGVRVVARQAHHFRARRLRRRARWRAVGRDRPHLPAQDLLQPAMDRLHDLHGAGRRPRHLRGRDPRRGRLLRHRGLVRRRRASGTLSGSARPRWSSRWRCRAASGAGSRTAPRCAFCRSAIGFDFCDVDAAKPGDATTAPPGAS